MFDLVILALSAWRLASLLVAEQGPAGLFARLRHAAGLRQTVVSAPGQEPQIATVAGNWLAEGLTCVWCVSVWTAALFVLGGLVPYLSVALYWLARLLAVSALAILVQEVISRLRGGEMA